MPIGRTRIANPPRSVIKRVRATSNPICVGERDDQPNESGKGEIREHPAGLLQHHRGETAEQHDTQPEQAVLGVGEVTAGEQQECDAEKKHHAA